MTFSNISSEMPPEEDGNEVEESVESPELQEEAQSLDQATFDSPAKVALEGSYQESEDVEAALTEVMQAAEGQAGSGAASKASEDDWEAPVAAEGGQGSRPGGGVEATPINLPNPQDEVSATPIPLPGQAREIEQPMDDVAIIDSNDSPRAAVDDGPRIVDKVDAVGIIDTNDGPRIAPDGMDDVAIIDSNDSPRSASEEVSATPIPLPDPQDEISTIPIPIPDPQDEISATPIPLPDPQDEISTIPIPLPDPQDEISATPIPLPGEGKEDPTLANEGIKPEALRSPKEVSMDGKGGDQVAIGTWPTPERQLDDIAIIDSNDGPRLGDDRVKIDTVPLPEDGLDGVAIIDTNDGPRSALDDGPRLGDDRVMIDTVPLPEDDLDGVAIIDSNDGPRDAVDYNPRTPLDDSLRDDLRMEEQGYLGEIDPIGEVGLPKTGVDDRIGGPNDILDGAPGKVDDPFDNIPEWGETEDGQSLADAAAAGADTRAGISTLRAITGAIWGAITKDTTDKGGGGGGVRGTPTPDAVEGTFEDPLGVMDVKEKSPTDYADSMMQPVDDEGQGREQPGMKMSADELRDAQLNPYIQNTDEHVDVLPGSGNDMTNPKDWLIDNDLEPFAPGAGGGGTNPLAKPSTNDDAPPPPPPGGGKPGVSMDQAGDLVSSKPPDGGDGKPPDGADQVFKPSTNDDAPPPPPPGGGKPGVSMDQAGDLVSSKPPDGGDGKPPDGADLVFKPSTNDDAPPPPPPGGGKPGTSMGQMEDQMSGFAADGTTLDSLDRPTLAVRRKSPPDPKGNGLEAINGLENSLSPDIAPADLSSMMGDGTMLNANENKNLKDLDENNTQNLEPTDGKL